MTDQLPFSGLRVLELSRGIAAAYAGKMLADAGAELLLAEPPGGHPMRRHKSSAIMEDAPPLADGETGVLFHLLNGTKQSVALDLAARDGRGGLFALSRDADLVLEDGALDAVGLTPEALQRDFPRLTIVTLTPWGRTGPYAGRPATEFTLQAEVGSTAFRGYADRPPVAPGGNVGDYVAGTFAAVAALAGWLAARGDNKGRLVDVSAFEAMLIACQPYQYIHGQLEPGVLIPRSIDIPNAEPAKDGWVGYTTVTQAQWHAFAEMIGHPELIQDKSLNMNYGRSPRVAELQPLIHAYTRQRSVAELLAEAAKRRIPVVPLGSGRSVQEMPHFKDRGVFQENPAGFRQPRPPYQMSRGAVRSPAAAPAPASSTGFSKPAALPKRPVGAGNLPLKGLRVLDLSAFWAGPVATALFAALGAEVVKVESVQRPDGMRYSGGYLPKDGKPIWEVSPVAHGANPGKKAITLDLTKPQGLALAKELVKISDVVIENFSPRVVESFGLTWDVVHDLNPNAVMVRMPAFGLDGPWRDFVGFAMTIELVSGLAWVTGYPDRAPLIPRGCVDSVGGMDAVFATLAALERRDRGAGGQLVEVTLAEAGINIAAEQVAEASGYGTLLNRHANHSAWAAPQGVFACADTLKSGPGMVAISVVDDRQWQALVKLAGLENRSEWRSIEGRRNDEDTIEAALAAYCATRPRDALVEALVAVGVPAAPLYNPRELQDHPHLRGRGFFHRFHHPVVGDIDYPNFPFRIDGAFPPLTTPAPLLGEHNEAVLCGMLGLSPEQIAELERAEVIGRHPIPAKG